jgi:HTH-type transcriptional regulator / antitoxin HigA
MPTRPPIAEVFPVGEHLADEIDARGWTQTDLAEILGRPMQFVSEIISGSKEITRESAQQLGVALGTSAELWLNLQNDYLLWLQAQDEDLQERLHDVAVRARLRELAPVHLMRKRGLLGSTDPQDQARELLGLFGMDSLDEEPQIQFAARRSSVSDSVTVTQRAWVACVRERARHVEAGAYSPSSLQQRAEELASLAREPAAFADFQTILATAGVKLVYLESFPGGRLDGCTFLQEAAPVIGISGRGKRLDKVLFTVLHEVAHVLLDHIDGQRLIVDDFDGDDSDWENAADQLAGQLILPKDLGRIPPRVNALWVRDKAAELDVHPIIVVGRLQKDGRLAWSSTLSRNAPVVTEYLEAWGPPN